MPLINFKFFIVKRLMFCVACCGVLFFTAEAQDGNLVPNPGFEERTDCDVEGSIFDAPPWFQPSDGTADVYHECSVVLNEPCPYPESPEDWWWGVPTNVSGCQEPNSGDGFAGAFFADEYGLGVEYKEYLGVPLLQPLIADSIYHIEFYVSMAETATHGTWMICAGFDADSLDFSEGFLPGYSTTISVDNYVILEPGNFITEREEWVKVEYSYEADGSERYLYIGNFLPFDETEFEQVVFPEDTIGVKNPLQYWASSFYYVDDVYVGLQSPVHLTKQPEILKFSIYPNPAKNFVQVESSTHGDLTIISSTGRIVKSLRMQNAIERLDISDLADGIYYFRLTSKHRTSMQKLIVSKALSP